MSFILKKGILGNILDNKISVMLGKYSFVLYLTHWVVMKFWLSIFWYKNPSFISKYPVLNLSILLFLIIIFAIFCHHYIEKENKCRKYVFITLFIFAGLAQITHRMSLKYGYNYEFNSIVPKITLSNRSEIGWNATLCNNKADMSFRLASKEKSKVIIQVFPYLTEEHPVQNVHIFSDHQEIASFKYEYGKSFSPMEFSLPQKLKQKITFVADNSFTTNMGGGREV